jgi:hypothetical protein
MILIFQQIVAITAALAIADQRAFFDQMFKISGLKRWTGLGKSGICQFERIMDEMLSYRSRCGFVMIDKAVANQSSLY